MDPEAAARALHRAGFLIPSGEADKRMQRQERVGLSAPVRLYVIRDTILSDAKA